MPDPNSPQKDWFSQFEEPSNDYFSQFEELPKESPKKEEPSLFSRALEYGKEKVREGEQFVGEHPNLRRFLMGPSEEELGGVKLNAPSLYPGEIPGLRKGISAVTPGNGMLKEYLPGILAGTVEGAFDPAAAGIRRGGGILNEVVRPPEVKIPEVVPNDIPIPKRTRQLPSSTYNVDLAGNVGVPPEGVSLPEGQTIIKTPQGTPALIGRGKKGKFGKIPPKPIYSGEGNVELPKNAEGIVTTNKIEPGIRQAEIVSEPPLPKTEPLKTAIEEVKGPEVKVRGPAQEYIDAVKSGKIDRSVGFADFQKNKESLMSRFVKEEKGEFSPFEMFKKIRGVDEKEANRVREAVIDTLIQGGRLDLEGIYGKTVGMNRKQFNRIVDEIIDTGAVGKVAEQIKINTPEPIHRLLSVLSEHKINRALQDAAVSQEKGKRFAAFSSELKKGEGKEGFFNAARQMSGEYSKVSSIEVELGSKDVQSLFDQIKTNKRITPGEQLRLGFALRDLLEGTRTLQPNELALMDRVYGPGIGNQIIQMHGGLGGVPIKLAKTANTMKSLNSTLDLSAPFRQGLGLVHRREFWDAYKQMYKYAGSHDAFMAQEAAMEAHPNYLLSRDAGLFTADHELGNFEEQFGDSYLHDLRRSGKFGKILTEPAAASERAYVGFLNKLRFDTFNSLLQKAEKAGLQTYELGGNGEKIPTELTREISNYINVSTGRGSLGRFNKIAGDLNTVLYSPRLIASRLTILNPKYYIDANPFVRKEALKTLLAIGGFTGITNELGSVLFGGQTKLTPTLKNLTNPDFGKIRWNKTRLDPGGGFNQYVVAASQFVTGKATPSSGKNEGRTYSLGSFGQPGRVGNLIGVGNPNRNSFLENKFSPMASLIDALISGKTDPETRKPYNMPSEVVKRFVPLITQDLYDLYKEDPELLGLGIPASMGMGLQTYGGSPASSGLSIGGLR